MTDQLIRAALAQVAAQAPDPHRVRTALAGRVVARRRAKLMVAVAAASGIVVAAAAGMWLWPRQVSQPVTPPSPTTSCIVSLFFNNDLTPAEQQDIGAELRRMDGVVDVKYESRAEAYQRFREIYAQAPDLVNSVHPDTFPASIQVTVTGVNAEAAVAQRSRGFPGADVVDQCPMITGASPSASR